MKDEIKEILDKLIKTSCANGVFLTANTRDKIIDYITTLQEENKQLKENKKELIEFLKEYDKYRDTFKWNEQDYIDTIEKIKEILGDKENE